MATTVHLLDVMEAEDNLSKAGRDWVVVGKPRKGDERDAMVAADRRFRVAYAHYHNYWPDHELDAEGNVVVHGHGALYIDREKITFGGRRTAAISVVQ